MHTPPRAAGCPLASPRRTRAHRTRRAARIVFAAAAFTLIAAAATLALAFALPVQAAEVDGDDGAASDAVRAVDALLHADAHTALRRMPPGFPAYAGYRPAVEDGMLVNPAGGCSSPVPLPASFAGACRAHDLGYDLLRYADAQGLQLGPWARRGLDAQLAERLHAVCAPHETVCRAAADAAAAAVDVNSWRQGYGVPLHEDVGLYALGGVGAAGAVFAAGSGARGAVRGSRRASALRRAGGAGRARTGIRRTARMAAGVTA
ncbi:hypothetical protein [Tomitella cavernea]|uniref:Phospholipase A2 n=1 Tax=Tomitella cavernea TaxID=1387982 RepID=A0ABP9CXE7_9ACTN|nr:hypothetical protein [Tomitella cavernea]